MISPIQGRFRRAMRATTQKATPGTDVGSGRTGKVSLSRVPDPRFSRHGQQPRGKYLDKRQFQLCKVDHAYREALRQRVSSAARWDAFIQGSPRYTGRPCERCRSTRRRVYNGACYDCMLSRNKTDFHLIRQGIHPPANRSRAGWLDGHERGRRERGGECIRYTEGRYTAEQFPTGRVRVLRQGHMDVQDLQAEVSPERVYRLAQTDHDFRRLLCRLGWIKPEDIPDASGPSPAVREAAPSEPDITHLEIVADAAVWAGALNGGVVRVRVVRRNGLRYIRALASLEPDEQTALCDRYWDQLPACIKGLADKPEDALNVYVRGKARGYFRT